MNTTYTDERKGKKKRVVEQFSLVSKLDLISYVL